MLAADTKWSWSEFHVGTGTCLNCGKWKGWLWGETGYFGKYGIQCTIGCSGFTSSRETENAGRMAGSRWNRKVFAFHLFQGVSLRPWFEECRTERKLITTVSSIISGHCGVKAHLKRFSIVDGSMCVCLEDHETVNHIIGKCSRFSSQRTCLIPRLLLSGVYEETPVRDLCAQLNWKALKECFMFFVECVVKMWLYFMLMLDTGP
jgi:hypothetical protein